MCVCVYGGCISQPWELLQVGVFPRVPPGSRGRPRGVSGPTAPSQPESPAPGDRGGRCGGRCGAPSCWCGQRDPGSAVRARRSRPAGAPLPRPLLGRGGNPVSTPPSLPSPPHPGGPTPLWPCLPRAAAGRDSAPPQAAPGGPGIPSVTHGTPLASPGSWGPACVRTSASSCIPALRLPLRAGRAAACGHPVGDPAVVTRDGRIPRVGVFAPPPFWAPPAHGPEAGGELPFPSPRVSSAALRLGDIPRFDDRQLLQGTTSRCRASRFGGGCLLWSRSRLGVCARVARRRLKNYFWNRRA